MRFLRTMDQPGLAALPDHLANDGVFRASLDCIETRVGHLAIEPASGAWAYLDDLELQLLDAIGERGATAGLVARSLGLDPALVAAHFGEFWRRGLLTVNGRRAIDPAARWAAIEEQSRDVFSLIMVLSSGCNLGCQYCYLGHVDPADWVAMSRERALRAADWALSRETRMTVIDLGEITVAGRLWRDLVEEIQVMADQRGRHVEMLIQTNGTSLDDETVDFIRRHQVSVGVSVDGPAPVHDRLRPFRGGKGTHARVLEGLGRLARAGVRYWVVATVGPHNVGDPEGLVDHLVALAPEIVLKPVLPFGEADGAWQVVGLAPEAYGQFLRRAVRRQLAHSPDRLDLTTRQFLARVVAGARGWTKTCTSRKCGCGETRLVLEADGRWTPCPRFGEYAGAPDSPPPDGILAPKLELPAWSRQLPALCRECSWQAHCGGGCALSGVDDPHCPAFKDQFRAIFEDVVPALLERPGFVLPGIGKLEAVAITMPVADTARAAA